MAGLISLWSVLLVALPFSAAQKTAGMPTIEVDAFTRLERKLTDAVVAQNRSQLESLLTDDFELRTARTGGELTLRDDWLQAATTTYRIRSYDIARLTVRELGDVAVVNFFYKQQASFGGRDISGDFFIVDVWQRTGEAWKLLVRYSAGPGATAPTPSNPKTKQ